jgi:hypothetical protein
MSRHVVLRCACGEAEVDGSAWFTSVVWDDVLGSLEALGIENPYHALPDEGRQVDPAELLAWWEDALGKMRGARERLPVLHRVWRGNQTDAGYCVCHGRGWMVDASYDELTAVALAQEVWEERRAGLTYVPPVVEETAPELIPAFVAAVDAARPEVPLAADAFERIFRGTPLTLEHGRLSDYFAAELRAVEALARHAADRGEPVEIYGY